MTWLEITGAAAIYIIAVFVSGYIAFWVTYFIGEKISPGAGLEGIIGPAVIGIAVWILGAIGGLIFIGWMIGHA